MTKIFVALCLALAFAGCSDSEQQAERDRQARKEREYNDLVRKQEQDKQELERKMREESAPQEPEEPASPPEPQYEETTWHMFTSSTEKVPVACQESEVTPCGVSFTHCKTDNEYHCQVSV
jgi:hypothetical protein